MQHFARNPSDVRRARTARHPPGERTNRSSLFALREKLEAVEGNYESYRGIQTVDVERKSGSLSVNLQTDLGDQYVTLFPENLDPDDQTFYFIAETGARVPVEFDISGDSANTFFQRWRLHRT